MQDLFLQLFKKNIDDPGNREMLMHLTKEYPYFTAAHFFLLKKTDNTQSDHAAIAAKTALHFNNAFLLNYQLNKAGQKEGSTKLNEAEKIEESQMPNETGNFEKAEIAESSRAEETKKMYDPEPKQVTEEKKEEEMIFEPLFATDYFASQGIKLSEEVQPADKLGKQLKSFTEWLKSMKKVHETKGAVEAVQIDLAVQNLAEKSNQEDEILTESMAEAYLQQGKMKKARETFEKLSLLNPAKSAYFAAKIEQIGSINS